MKFQNLFMKFFRVLTVLILFSFVVSTNYGRIPRRYDYSSYRRGSYFLTVMSQPSGSLETSEIHSEVKEFLRKKGIKGEPPAVLLKYYKNPDNWEVESIISDYMSAAKATDFEGVIVWYFKGRGIAIHSYSDKISEEDTKELTGYAVREKSKGKRDKEVIKGLLKRLAAKSAGVGLRKEKLTVYVEKSVGNLEDEKLILSCEEEKIALEPISKEEQSDRFRFVFEIPQDKIKELESGGCETDW